MVDLSLKAVGTRVGGGARHMAAGTGGDGRQTGRFRTDIQALRALAVGLVVLNHLWPLRLPGGYVGVDVFFVISGYLISSHLLREIQASGKVRLGVFYSRRARRLFPAAFLVLGGSMLLAVLFLPYPRWITTAQEVLASVFYVENWLLAAKSVDYSAMTESASAVQHYWSLSVEEQFYLFWPLLLVLLAGMAKRGGTSIRRTLMAGVSAVAVVSLGISIYMTETASAQSYFATPTRVWEFAAGALIALVGVRLVSLALRNLLAVSGFALILASALIYDTQTPFPGWTALAPVAGTALVIIAGTGEGRLAHSVLTGLRPVQFIGKISYSLYLWHWPLIVAAPFALEVEPTAPHKLAMLAVAILLAWATKQWVEDRWIGGGQHKTPRGRGFGLPVTGMLVTALVAGLLAGAGVLKERQAVELAAAGIDGPCYGPAAIGNRNCGDPFTVPVAVPHMGPENEYWHMPEECGEPKDLLVEGGEPPSCDFSGGDPEADVVWVVGDSHAQQWMPAVAEVARERGWLVKWTLRGACPFVDVPAVSFNGADLAQTERESCAHWSRVAAEAIEEDRPEMVFLSTFGDQEVIDDGTGRAQSEQYTDGLVRDWQRWVNAEITVVPITDPPLNGIVRSPECLVFNAEDPAACAVPREQALGMDPFAPAVARIDSPLVKPVDLTDYFCDRQNCFSAVGGVGVYFDANHLNAKYVEALSGHLAELLD
ncbi:acyltransferase family protein [Arthrobacter sp. zg-Y877]|uniref:acyltransferase family protein n=1 Tax=Arthrobacter sp. zg-Y877 TaxID=3049074 RepID=UPI0025A367D9|nr:acyltransferase family protein [Arthrobacter sp. zg-Y877]MDM7990202.1 acyltransferase family protein [Arthrobacter sp. zg-Y877]